MQLVRCRIVVAKVLLLAVVHGGRVAAANRDPGIVAALMLLLAVAVAVISDAAVKTTV